MRARQIMARKTTMQASTIPGRPRQILNAADIWIKGFPAVRLFADRYLLQQARR